MPDIVLGSGGTAGTRRRLCPNGDDLVRETDNVSDRFEGDTEEHSGRLQF